MSSSFGFLRIVILLRALLLALNIIFAVALLLSYFASAISPQQFWPLSFFGLAFPFLLLMNVMFIALWSVQQNYLLFISLIVIVMGWSHLTDFLAVNIFPEEKQQDNIRIMSYNVQNFNLYNWNENIRSRDSMIAVVDAYNPDIVCFQEFYASEGGDFKMIPIIKERLDMPYYYFQTTYTTSDTNHWGIATFSKFPIVGEGNLEFTNSRSNACIYVDVKKEDQIFRVFNMHLQSIHFGYREYEYIDKVLSEQDADIESSRMILGKLKRAYVKRAAQADAIKKMVNRSPYPVILCGDFNDTPVSYTYDLLKEGMQDAFINKGSGIGHTYAGKLPGLRIDYILMDDVFKINGFNRVKRQISDHYPILADFQLSE